MATPVGDARFAGFSADAFRTAIKATMRMGLPQSPALRATFRWTTANTYAAADNDGSPWDLSAAPTTTDAHADVLIDCAVEFVPRATLAGGTAVGHFDTPRAIITLLDEDYDAVVGATHVLLGENTYSIDFWAPEIGLFDVTVHQVHISAVDEV